MRLVLIGKGTWTVYAVCTDETTCPLLDFIEELDSKRSAKVLSDLREYVPTTQPSDWTRTDFSWPLRGNNSILEFRWPTKGGGTPRVFWFYDKGRIIVCTSGFNKKGTIDASEIAAAEATKAAYLKDQLNGQLTIVELDNFDPPDNGDEER